MMPSSYLSMLGKTTPFGEPLEALKAAYNGDDDDKYAKFGSAQKPTADPLKQYFDACLKNYASFVAFACFVLASGAAYVCAGRPVNGDQFGRFASSNFEILGLLLLRHKIGIRASVNGISGMTIVMYAIVYFQRITISMPDSFQFAWKDLDFDASFGVVSFLLVLDILKAVFVTHKSTYQSDLDVLKVKYLIPACYISALLVRPHFGGQSLQYSYWWSSCLYMDVLALMPQVVMMAQGKTVQAPIAHFVAATFVSRVDDLMDSLVFETSLKENNFTSYWTVVFFQAIHLFLVGDFMYYYMKAQGAKSALMEDVKLIEDDVC